MSDYRDAIGILDELAAKGNDSEEGLSEINRCTRVLVKLATDYETIRFEGSQMQASHSSQLSAKDLRISELEKALREVAKAEPDQDVCGGGWRSSIRGFHLTLGQMKAVTSALFPNLGEPKQENTK